jgi:hypothetical protein
MIRKMPEASTGVNRQRVSIFVCLGVAILLYGYVGQWGGGLEEAPTAMHGGVSRTCISVDIRSVCCYSLPFRPIGPNNSE